jgi:hypothetical protein
MSRDEFMYLADARGFKPESARICWAYWANELSRFAAGDFERALRHVCELVGLSTKETIQ